MVRAPCRTECRDGGTARVTVGERVPGAAPGHSHPSVCVPGYHRGMNYELFMGEALAEARQARSRGARAVGAVVVVDEAMVARAADRVEETNDPTAHAVITALREAARRLGSARLSDATVFTTLEPCAMCVGAILQCDATALVFAAPSPEGAAGSSVQLAQHPGFPRRIEVVSGIRRAEAEELLEAMPGALAGA